jgi:hypothetical protein
MFFVLDPSLSGATDGDEFLQEAKRRLELAQAVWVDDRSAARAVQSVRSADAIVFCNPPVGSPVNRELDRILRAALRVEATILPVAADSNARIPPDAVRSVQSWDLQEFQAMRNHLDDHLEPAANEFARMALAQVEPTCFTRHPVLFLAHRRLDGEDFARRLDGELRRRGALPFRDLIDVTVGGDAQTEIDRRLAACDALVFIDTPQIGESWAATFELRRALEERIPVLWLKLDAGNTARAPLVVLPGGAPDLERSGPPETVDAADIADHVVQLFHAAASRLVIEANSLMADLLDLDQRDGMVVERLRQIPAGFRIERARQSRGLPERPLVHLCQIFGRRTTSDDARAFHAQLHEVGLLSDVPADGCDAVVLLDPRPRAMESDGAAVILSGQDYLAQLGGKAEDAEPVPLLLISGSWSGGGDEEVLRAVADLSEEWLRQGGGLVFGGHPTFTPVIVGAARRVHPVDPQAWVTAYQSEQFTSLEAKEAAGLHLTVITTRDEGDRERSLALMRTRMFEHPGIVVAVTIGGRTDSDGTDDEFRRARTHQIPSVVLAVPGGRAASIAAELDAANRWSRTALPPISSAQLRDFSRRSDYRGVARDLFAALGHR